MVQDFVLFDLVHVRPQQKKFGPQRWTAKIQNATLEPDKVTPFRFLCETIKKFLYHWVFISWRFKKKSHGNGGTNCALRAFWLIIELKEAFLTKFP